MPVGHAEVSVNLDNQWRVSQHGRGRGRHNGGQHKCLTGVGPLGVLCLIWWMRVFGRQARRNDKADGKTTRGGASFREVHSDSFAKVGRKIRSLNSMRAGGSKTTRRGC